MLDPKYKVISKTKDEHKYEIIVSYDNLDIYQEKSYQELSKNVKIEGFRPGKAPREKIEQRIAPDVLNLAINNILTDAAIEVLENEKASPVNQPRFDVKKIDKNEGIIFEITFVNYPEVKLGDISKFKIEPFKKVEKLEDKELDKEIKSFLISTVGKAKLKSMLGIEENKEEKKGSDTLKNKNKEDNTQDHKEDEHDNDHSEVDEHDLHDHGDFDFELNDELVAKLEMKDTKTVEDFRKLFSSVVLAQRNVDLKNKYLSDVVKKLVAESQYEIPDLFIDNEVMNIENELMSRLADVNLDVNVYLQSQNTSLEKMREEWKKAAVENIKQDLVLFAYAKANEIEPSDDDVEKEFSVYKKQRGTGFNEASITNIKNNIRAILLRRNAVKHIEEKFLPKS